MWKDVPVSPPQGAKELLVGLAPWLAWAVAALVCFVVPIGTDEGHAALSGVGIGGIMATFTSVAWARSCLRKAHWTARVNFSVSLVDGRAAGIHVDRVIMQNRYMPDLDWVLADDVPAASVEDPNAKVN